LILLPLLLRSSLLRSRAETLKEEDTRGQRRIVTLVGLGLLGLGVPLLCLFTVDAGGVAIVTQFGNPVRVESVPGLHVKYPYPIQSVITLDRRVHILVPPSTELLTLEKKNVVASGYIVWRIADPQRFLQTVFDRTGAESRLSDILSAELGAAFGNAPMSAFVSVTPGQYRAEKILADVTRQYRELARRDYGIEVADVGLRRLDFPEQNRLAVFARMKSERIQMSTKYRSEGEEEGLKIRATSEKTRSSILAEAYMRAQKSRGEGEAAAAKIYAESLSRGPAFYQFTRSMDTLKKAVDKDTTLVLPVDTELFRLLRDSRAQFAGP
jgi:modulator of FtsH protease HflC